MSGSHAGKVVSGLRAGKVLSGPHAGKVFTLGCSSGEGFDDEGKYFNTVWHWVDLISDFDFYTLRLS